MSDNLDFIKGQVLIAKSFTPGPNGRQHISRVVFVDYFLAKDGLNCTVKDQVGVLQKVNSSNLSNIMLAEAAMAKAANRH